MKNIERPEIQELISRYLEEHDFSLYEKLAELGMPNYCDSRLDWFNQEYVEPHKWEPWELEVLKHISKVYSAVKKYDENGLKQIEFNGASQSIHLQVNWLIDFPSMKEGEEIDIDAELERNGMHR